MTDGTEVVTAMPSAPPPETPVVEQKQPETPAPQPEKVETPTTPEPEPQTDAVKEPEPVARPGTPDKVLQRMQQDAAAAQRRIEALESKVDRGEAVSPREAQQLQEDKRTIRQISDLLPDYDPFDEAKHKQVITGAVKAIQETDGDVQNLKKTTSELQQELAQLRQERYLQKIEQDYPDVDRDSIWKNAVDDAKGHADAMYQALVRTHGPEIARTVAEQAWHVRSHELFNERAKNAQAAKNAAAANNTAPATKPATAVKPMPPVTKGGAAAPIRPSAATVATELSPSQKQMAAYAGLWKPDN